MDVDHGARIIITPSQLVIEVGALLQRSSVCIVCMTTSFLEKGIFSQSPGSTGSTGSVPAGAHTNKLG